VRVRLGGYRDAEERTQRIPAGARGDGQQPVGRDRLPNGRSSRPGSVRCFDYPEFHRSGVHIPFGVAANRPCPAWHFAPITVKAVTRELHDRFWFVTSVSHTRPLPNRGPCLMAPRGTAMPLRTPALVLLRLRDRWEDVGRSLTQLVLGAYMVRQARRLRLCERYFDVTRATRSPLVPPGTGCPVDRW
jgi:hypothetical protein